MSLRYVPALGTATVFLALTACREAPPRMDSPAPGARVGGDTLAPGVSAEGDYTIVFDGQGFGRGPVPLIPVADGPHRLALRDGRGQTFEEREIIVDRTPPGLRILRPAPVGPFGVATGEAVRVEVEALDAGPLGAVMANGVVLTPGPYGRFSGSLPLPADGPLTVTLSATDAAGNRAEAKVESTPGLIRWQVPMPVEPGDWTARLLSDDSVLIALGDAALVVGPDGRERWTSEAPGRVLVESLDLPDASVLLRLLHPSTPGAAEVRFIDPSGKAVVWNRPEAVPLALATLGESPYVAWRVGESAEGGRAPGPWPPIAFSPTPLPFEPHQLVPWRQHLVAVGGSRLAILDSRGEPGFQMEIAPGARAVPSGDTLYVVDTTGMRIIDRPDITEARRVSSQAVTHACPLPPNGLAYAFADRTEVRATADSAPNAGPVVSARSTYSDDDCVAIQDPILVPVVGDLAPLPTTGPIRAVQRVGGRLLAVLGTEPPRAAVLSPLGPAFEQPLDGLANIIRTVSLPDGLLVVGLSSVRPDKAVLMRLALGEAGIAPGTAPGTAPDNGMRKNP